MCGKGSLRYSLPGRDVKESCGGVSPGVSKEGNPPKLEREAKKLIRKGNGMRVWELKECVAPGFTVVCAFLLF